MRVVMFLALCSSLSRSRGCRAVRFSKIVLFLVTSGSSKLIASTRSRAKYFSSFFGGRTCPEMVSPERRLKRLIWEWET